MFAVDVSVVDLGIRSLCKLGMTVASLGDADEKLALKPHWLGRKPHAEPAVMTALKVQVGWIPTISMNSDTFDLSSSKFARI